MSKQTLNEMSSSTIRSLSDISETETIHLSVDLVSAARRNIGFLRSVYECQWLHQRATIIEAIRRYDEVWMPLISNLTVEGSTPPMVLPPFDVEWVWFCHTLNPVGYRKYCETRFSKQIGKPAIFNEENEEYALMRCKQIWVQKFSSEPFENEVESDSKNPPLMNKDLFNQVEKHKFLYSKFAEPYLSELVYLIAARQRYKGFLYMMQRFGDRCFRFVPALDILLMLLTHQACVFVRLSDRTKATNADNKHKFLRLRMLRCHRELKLDKPITDFSCDSWRKAWHLYCEFGTKGLMVELRCRGGSGLYFKGSKLVKSIVFCWNDLVRAPCITLRRDVDEMRVVASITSPVQAPYLLKCVPDRVTDDSGAMVSDVILKLNNYRPQKGRWLSRTVLDHAGRECFVVRIRVGGGFWRRGAETPCGVNWEERIIEIREGSWSYVAGSIGKAPEKVVGTATPKEPPQQWQAAWLFSTGDEFLINWGSSTSSSDLTFCLKIQQSSDSSQIMLLRGRKMQYHEETKSKVAEADDGFVTIVRFTEDNPTGRTTALLNWKLSVVELLPEEDAVLVLLLCVSILRTVSEITKEDVGQLLVRRRLKEAKLGARDWGSVLLHPSSLSSSSDSPYLHPWYLNANKVMAQHEDDGITRQPGFKHSPVEGGDMLYKRGIIT
ncbi:hypothetical protein ES332_A11G311900v1 [Gossypium tomentosum]|uniref:GRPD C-terminal domain-containing protein n=1 Tax=Gossypium tomentosum TaxID=34277 RepID=A0A5D2NG47_GOSTO|nr:hypothetical protein ES332_A11G311900v1 [Gossypium tomentosum]